MKTAEGAPGDCAGRLNLPRAGVGQAVHRARPQSGDVAFVAAKLVGPDGEVVAIDRTEGVLARARARAEERGIRNVRFVQGDEASVASIAAGQLFDAVVGRLVLVHQRDAAGSSRSMRSIRTPEAGASRGFRCSSRRSR